MKATSCMQHGADLKDVLARVRAVRPAQHRGKVSQVTGLVIESEGPVAAVGEVCRVQAAARGADMLAEVVGFRGNKLLLMALGDLAGIYPGSEVSALGRPLEIRANESLQGRVINALGQPLDDKGPLGGSDHIPLALPPPHPLRRQRIRSVFRTGIKALDTFIPCGRGQRMGIFAGSGVGKSTLLGMMAGQAEADVNVIALVGERGREVREFLEKDLDEEARRKSVVIVATSNEPPLLRLKGAFLAMGIAEYFRDKGKNVLLMMDSVTRFAMAQREIGLAIGEPPATRGYTPSVFALLPQLLERAGAGEKGFITGLFTVLVEADDMNDPIADSVRSILDGHIVLSRDLATHNHYPAIDVLESISRLNRDLLSAREQELTARGREYLATYRKNQDLINIGAYPAGSNAAIDEAIRMEGPMNSFLRQAVDEHVNLAECWKALDQILSSRPAAKQPGK